MSKRAVDLSLQELAAMGANAALKAANEARDAGLTVTGTVDFHENGQTASSLAERQPSGVVTLLDAATIDRGDNEKPTAAKTAIRQTPTD
jgi:dienelactone hydrolase